jgi:hypothetical protein
VKTKRTLLIVHLCTCKLTAYIVNFMITFYTSRKSESLNKQEILQRIAYFSFSAIWVSDTTSRKKTLVCTHNEVDRRTQFQRLQCQYYRWKEFMNYSDKMASCATIYMQSFLKIGATIENSFWIGDTHTDTQ